MTDKIKINQVEPHIHSQLKLNLKKIEWMIKKINSMLDGESYCPEMSQQINATIGLLNAMNRNLLKLHLKACAIPQLLLADTSKIDTFIDEFLKIASIAKGV